MRLAELQRRFHDAVTGRAPLATACDLVRDDGVAPRARLHVYAHAYAVRIRGAIAAEYPKLAAVLGAEGFTALVARYLERHPTRHPSLRDAGIALPRFLAAETRWHADLAAIERARTEVFDGPDAAPLRRADLAALAPGELPTLVLRLVPSSAIVPLRSNADEVWAAIEDETTLPLVVSGSRVVIVWRRDATVVHRTVDTADERGAIDALARGLPFGALCAMLAEHPDAVPRAVALTLRWIDAGLLARARP